VAGINIRVNPASKAGFYIAVITDSLGQRHNRGLGTADRDTAIKKSIAEQERINAKIAATGTVTGKLCTMQKVFDDLLATRKEATRKKCIVTINRMLGQRIDNITGEIHYHDRQGRELRALCKADDLSNSITPDAFGVWWSWISTQLADSSLRSHLTKMQQMFDFAAAKGFEVPSIDFRALYGQHTDDQNHTRNFTESEVAMLIEYFENSRYDHNKYRFFMLLHTGLRVGEVCTIRRENVDLMAGTIRIKRTKKRRTYWETIPLNDTLLPLLQEWWDMTRTIDSEWLFCKEDGTMFSSQTAWLRNAMVKLGINNASVGGTKLTAHSCRSRFISLQLADPNIPIAMTQKSVGHSSITTTMIYERLDATKAMRDATNLMHEKEVERLERLAELERRKAIIEEEIRLAKELDNL